MSVWKSGSIIWDKAFSTSLSAVWVDAVERSNTKWVSRNEEVEWIFKNKSLERQGEQGNDVRDSRQICNLTTANKQRL